MQGIRCAALVAVMATLLSCSADRVVEPTSSARTPVRVTDRNAASVPLSKGDGTKLPGTISAYVTPGCTIGPVLPGSPLSPIQISVDGTPPNPRARQLDIYVGCPGEFDQIVSGRSLGYVWVSQNGGVATVSSSGVVTAVSAGTASICVLRNGVSGCAIVTVVAASFPQRVLLNPSAFSVRTGFTTQLSATVYNQFNNVISAPVTWSSLTPSNATVSSSGVVTGGAYGIAQIRACAQASGVTVCGQANGEINPPTASISGPSPLSIVTNHNTVRTYTAVTGGGDGSFTYQWIVKRPYGAVEFLGTASSQGINFTCFDQGENEIELEVRTGGKVINAFRYATVNIPYEQCPML
jgi:hypothetical protein